MYNDFFIEEENYLKEIDKSRCFAKKILFGGILGLTYSGIISYFSDQMGTEFFKKPLNNLNINEMINSMIFITSSLGFIGGGLFYGIQTFIKNDIKKETDKINKNIKKDLTNKL